MAASSVSAQAGDYMRPHKSGARPGSETDKIGATTDRLQAVMADLQPKQCKVPPDGI